MRELKNCMLLLRFTLEFIDEKLRKWVFEIADSDELTNHPQQRGDRPCKDPPEQFDDVEVCLTCQSNSKEVCQQSRAFWELF